MSSHEYRQSKAFLISKIILMDIPLMFVFVGLFTIAIRILSYMTAKLVIKEKTIALHHGIINRQEIEIPYSKINAVSVKQGLLGSVLHYGDIIITTGNDISGIPFVGIANPQEVKQQIHAMIG